MWNEKDQDLYALMFTGPAIFLALFGGATGWIIAQGQVATSWLIQHHILVSADQAVIPILDAGLDVPRCALLAALLALILWGMIASARKQRARKA